MARAKPGPRQYHKGQPVRRFALRRIGAVLLIAAVLLFVLIYLLPGLLGRYLIATELDKLGIRHQGIDSVEIDLPNGRLRFGPVTLVAAEGKPGVIGEMAIDVALGDLVDK